MTEPDPPVNTSVPRRHRVLFWSGMGVALAALAAGTVVAVTGYVSQSGPDAVVRSYFAALDRGDAQSALGYGDVPSGNRAYLTDEVLKAQLAIAPITSLRTAPEVGGRVMIDYSIGGTKISDAVPMIKRDGRWRLVATAVRSSLTLSAASQRATFAGTAVPSGPSLLFPGSLPIRFDTPDLTVSGTAVARFSSGTAVNHLTVAVSPSGRNAVSAALVTALNKCVAPSGRSPLCPGPSALGVRSVPASLRGTIDGTPTVQTDVAPEADGKLLISGTAKVNGSYQSLDYQNQVTVVTGPVDVAFKAHSYAGAPANFVWDAS